jgi:hypothetical protein
VQFLIKIIFGVSIIACIWFGFANDIEGLRNIAYAVIWGFILPVSLLAALSPYMQSEIARDEKEDPPVWQVIIGRLLSGVALALLVWFGAFVTAGAWVLAWLSMVFFARIVRKMRSEMQAKQTGSPEFNEGGA